MKLVVSFEFTHANLEKARRWAKEKNITYRDESLLLIDALESGLFDHDYVRIEMIKKGDK